jgi:HTH-type transcriptional regulator / antitoxin HipB
MAHNLPIGKATMTENQITDTRTLGELIRSRRTALGLRQPDLALAANVGIRFIVEIENGKETCQIGLTLRLLKALGIDLFAHTEAAPSPSTAPTAETGISDEDKGFAP